MIEEYVKSIDKLRYQNRSLISNLQSLSNLNSKLVNLTIKLTKESNALDSFANKIGNYYSIDNNPINSKIMNNKDDVDSVIEYINGIVSGINENIESTNRIINENKNRIKRYEKKVKAVKDSYELN